MLKLLSLDGGGIGGIYTISLLERIEEETAHQFCASLDAIAGTSTGAIIACALASGMKPKEIRAFYFDLAPAIFARKWHHKLLHLDRLLGAPYDGAKLENLLSQVFGQSKLGELQKKVLIPTLDLDRERFGIRQSAAKFLTTFPGINDDREHGVVEAIMKSVSAPTYFEPYQNRYIDGGLVQNNPAASLIVECLDHGYTIDKMALVSLGTGKIPPFVDSQKKVRWGLLNFIRPLIDSLTNSNMAVSDKFATKLLGAHYLRYAKPLSRKYQLDNPADMNWIYQEAKTLDISELVKFIKGFFQLYRQNIG